MKSRNTLIRSKKFQLDEKRRKVAQMEAMIADFQRMAVDQRDQSRDRAAEEGREQEQLDALAALRARGALA